MKKTKDILIQFKKMIDSGSLLPQDVPVSDIKECVEGEINLYKNTYLQEQYLEVLSNFDCFCSSINDGETDSVKIKMFIDGMLICLSTISEAVFSLINKDYWNYKHLNCLYDPEISEIVEFVDKTHTLRLLNYDFVENYKPDMYKACYDESCGMIYIPYKGRKMYFPQNWDSARALEYFCSVVSEQDKHSPHCYRKNGFEVEKNCVIVDAGAAEGLFSLDNIDSAKKIYLVDADIEWIGALRKTFADDLDKVEIIHGYLGNGSPESNTVSLDSIAGNDEIGFIKMDIEGYERDALSGSENILKECKNVICAICSYHCNGDEEWIKHFLNERGFITDNSSGYIFPDWETGSVISAELRRGVVFGKKRE